MILLRELINFWWQIILLILFVARIRNFKFLTLTARTKYCLWLIPLIRIMIPIRFIPFPIYRSWNKASEILTTETAQSSIHSAYWSLQKVIILIYFVVCTILFIYLILMNILYIKRLNKQARHLKENIFYSPTCHLACSIGIGKYAKILVSKEKYLSLKESELDMIIAHEKGHICHYDFFWNIVRSVLIVLFWYNPFIYLAVYLSKKDAEMAADEFAVNFSGEGKHHAYAKLLVEVQSNEIEKYRRRLLSLQTDFSTQYKKTKDRIIGVYAQSTIRSQARSVRLLYSLALTLIISIVFLSSYLYADVQVDYSSSEIRATSVAGRDLNSDTIGTSAILAVEEDFAHDSMTTYTVETETSNDRLNNQEIYSIDFTIATAATAQDTEEIAVAYETRETAVAIETTRD